MSTSPDGCKTMTVVKRKEPGRKWAPLAHFDGPSAQADAEGYAAAYEAAHPETQLTITQESCSAAQECCPPGTTPSGNQARDPNAGRKSGVSAEEVRSMIAEELAKAVKTISQQAAEKKPEA